MKKLENIFLFLVVLGGRAKKANIELHDVRWVVGSKFEAQNIAKSKWLIGCKKKHKDDIASLEILLRCDDCELIKKIGKWQIELIPDNNFIEENNYPDWYGYQKIDGI